MQLVSEEYEPIVTATVTASEPPSSAMSTSAPLEEEPHKVCRLDRVAKVCAARIGFIERNLSEIGRAVSRLSRHYDRERGLTALAAKITKEHGKTVSRQYLRQALCVFEGYSKDETENRFSLLSNTHLLKAAQAFPGADDVEKRNELLDQAVRDNSSVADLVATIKTHKASIESEDKTTPDAPLKEPRGYIHGDVAIELEELANRSIAFLRIRESITPVKAIEFATRLLSFEGLFIAELEDLDTYSAAIQAIKPAVNLTVLHTLVVTTSSMSRNAQHNLPIADRFRVIVIIGRNGYRNAGSQSKRFENPMNAADAEELIFSLIPTEELVVDIGNGSIKTAVWAKANDREFLALEPDKDVHAKNTIVLETNPPTQVENSSSPSEELDPWPMVTISHRERVFRNGESWNDFSCCERTQLAIVVSAANAMTCPVCNKRCTVKPGARS